MKVVNRPPLIFRAVTTWRRAKLAAVAVSMIGIPLCEDSDESER